jgi:hypothetical protein
MVQYEGIIYKYNKVAFETEKLDSGDIPLRFTYDIMTNPNKEDILSMQTLETTLVIYLLK